MKIKDILKKHEESLKRAPQEVEEMDKRIQDALVRRCQVWFEPYWDELEVVEVDHKKGNALSVVLMYQETRVEIVHRLNHTPRALTGMSEHPLPTIRWGRETFPTPVDEEMAAQIFFDARLKKMDEEAEAKKKGG